MPKSSTTASRGILAAVALGVAGVSFLDALLLAVSSRHDAVYHLVGSVWVVFLPLVLNVLGLAALLFAGLLALRRWPAVTRLVCAAMLGFVPWILAKNISYLRGITFSHHASVGLFLECLVCTVVLGLAPWTWALWAFEAVWTAGRAFLAVAGCVVLITLIQVMVYGFEARHLNDASQPAEVTPAGVTPPPGRVVWIVLDELGYEQIFGSRLPGLALPGFDGIAAQATVFSNVRPAGMFTEFVLPSLMTGDQVSTTSASADGRRMMMTTPGGDVRFDPHNTVFADADAMGYRSGVVGWYNPYCRILAPVLTSCYWTGHDEISGLFPARTFSSNLFHPAARLLHKIPAFIHHPSGPSRDERDEGELHIEDFVNLDRESKAALRSNNADFLLLHLPVPHPTGIWDRRTHKFSVDRSSYIDNLALADEYLSQVRQLLTAKGEWDADTVVIMGDHAWRTQLLWIGQTSWKPVDQRASHGGAFDDRPGYIVKLPVQQTSAVIAQPYSAVDTRLLLDELLAHKIQTPAQLAQWVASAPQH